MVVVANLGRLDQIAPKQLDPLNNGLNRAVGRAQYVFRNPSGARSQLRWCLDAP